MLQSCSLLAPRVSIHAPRAGSDMRLIATAISASANFNPRSPCRERQPALPAACLAIWISIHAPRAGSDLTPQDAGAPTSNFNPRSPCGERREALDGKSWPGLFQSTLPVRGATRAKSARGILTDFNPRSPCGERPDCFKLVTTFCAISIHAPRAGSDDGARRLSR